MSDDSVEPTLHQVGEFTVIDNIVRGRIQSAGVTVGPGDDAAVLAAPDGRVVVSTDMLVEGSHFRLDWSTPHQVGRKAIAQNATTNPVTRAPTPASWPTGCGPRRPNPVPGSSAATWWPARSGWCR